MAHPLASWSQYLRQNDYEYVIEYVENLKNNRKNDKMMILSGPGRSGKSTLIRDIFSYIGKDECIYCGQDGSEIYGPLYKLWNVCDISDQTKKKNIQLFENLIEYGQSIISDTPHVERVNSRILAKARIIQMEHIF